MSRNPPSWWYNKNISPPALLSPISYLYGKIVCYRWEKTKSYKSQIPVICIGNFTVGGAGKTPTSLYICNLLIELGERPVFLSRGYGGTEKGPRIVSFDFDHSGHVGDEPLLLAKSAPTVICANRAKGAEFIEQHDELDPSVIIMDDGFQNPGLHKDLNIVVIDAMSGIGNGRVFPSGPLRAPLDFQKTKADILLTIGKSSLPRIETPEALNISATIEPVSEQQDWLKDPIIAYTGIARPEKFYKTLQELGANIKQTFSYPDHHQFSEKEVKMLLNKSKSHSYKLVTTEKDFVRLRNSEENYKELRASSNVVKVDLSLSQKDRESLKQVISDMLFDT